MSTPTSATDPDRPDRRAQILAAAEALVREGGIEALSVRSVAARTGIGASTLRYYFPSQRDLNEAVAARLLVVELDDRRIGDRRMSPARRLVECLEQFVDTGDDRAAALGWLDLVHAAVTGGPDSLAAHLLAGFSVTARERVQDWLARLAAEGQLAVDDLGRATSDLLVRIDGIALARLTPPTPIDVDTARRLLREEVERLLER